MTSHCFEEFGPEIAAKQTECCLTTDGPLQNRKVLTNLGSKLIHDIQVNIISPDQKNFK